MVVYRNHITTEIRKTASQEMKAVKLVSDFNYIPLLMIALAVVAIFAVLVISL